MHPGPWEFVLLALAAYRVFRLVAKDSITEPIRAAASYPDDEAVTLGYDDEGLVVIGMEEESKPLRVYVATLLRCPWCMGFYVSVAAWGAWLADSRVALFVAAPLAISGAVGLVSKTLDP